MNSLFIELEDAEAKSSLPDMPNRKLLSRIVSETYLNHWSAMKHGLPELRKK